MARLQALALHPDNPQPRLLRQAADAVGAGAIATLPTVAGYVVACRLGDKSAAQRLQRLTGLTGISDREPPLLLCRDLAQAAAFLKIDDQAYRAIRRRAAGAASFALPATRQLPRRLVEGSRGQALLYFAGHAVGQALLELLGEPLLLATPADGAGADSIEQLPHAWRAGLDLALDAGLVPALAVFPPRRAAAAAMPAGLVHTAAC